MSQSVQALVADIDAYCAADNWRQAIQLLHDGFDEYGADQELVFREELLGEVAYDEDSRQPNEIYYELIRHGLARSRRSSMPAPAKVSDNKANAKSKVIIETELAGRIPISQRLYAEIGKRKHGWHRCDRSGCNNIYTTDGQERLFGFLTLPVKLEKVVKKSGKKHDRSGRFNKFGMRKRNAHQPGSKKHFYCSPHCKEIADQIEKGKKSSWR